MVNFYVLEIMCVDVFIVCVCGENRELMVEVLKKGFSELLV